MLSWNNLAILFDLDNKTKQIKELDDTMAQDDFWNDPKKAQSIITQANDLKKLIETYNYLNTSTKDLLENINSLNKDYDIELMQIVEEEFKEVINKFEEFEISMLLKEPYDHSNAIIELHPGAGGTESSDWAFMLYEMYSKWANLKGFKTKILDYQDGDVAGIKSVSMLVSGPLAYGYLKGEKGVHRLVRISPFDSSGRRHTSFASVDIMPEFNDEIEIIIEDKDIIVDTMRASGAGGQHVNKTDSAVRITHVPTNIVVTCQTERSQIQNKDRCMNMLKSKLYQIKIEEQLAKVKDIKGDQKLIEWGSQIRSYVFCPYTMVKDHRTKYEETDVSQVMNGEIDNFMFTYLKSQI